MKRNSSLLFKDHGLEQVSLPAAPLLRKHGQLGKGMINAFNALSSISTVPPEKITHLEVSAKSNTLAFTADLPKDPDADFAYCYKVYYSTSPFTELEHSSAMTATFVAAMQETTGEGYYKFYLNGLKFNTDYYYGVVAADFAAICVFSATDWSCPALRCRPAILPACRSWARRICTSAPGIRTMSSGAAPFTAW